ncbi:MAG: DUF11 domain-containing protein, partial [ANME-2 cluster archaeon]
MNTIIGNSVAKVITALAVMLGVLSNRLTNSTEAFLRPGHGKPGARAAFLTLSLIAALIVTSPAAIAADGDFSIDFVAADPYSYDHLIGGGAYDNRTINTDVVESLEGGDFSCGDIVTYFAAVTVDNTQSAIDDQPQTIEMDFSFLADTTGQSGVAIGDIVLVQVNYGEIVDLITGENNVDDGIIDDGGSTATLIYENLTGPLFTPKSELHGTVELNDLEPGEQVVVRIDVKLFCDPGSAPTGNLAGALPDARLTYINDSVPVDPPEAISVGKQTVPFKQIGEICFPELVIEKTVTTSDGTCSGLDELTITSGDTVKYCYVVTNPNTCGAPLYNVKVVDDNGTSGNTADDFIVTLDVGLSDEDGDGSSDDLAAGGTATGEALVTLVYTSELPVINTGTAAGNDSIIEPTTLTASDTAAVTVVGTPSINLTKTMTNNADEDGSNDVSLGDTLTYTFDVTNDGDLNLDPVTVTDPMPGLSAISCDATSLVSGASMTCTATYTVTQADVDAGWINNTATATGSPTTGGDVTDTDDENVTVPQDPSINLTKTMSANADEDESGDVSLGDTLTYTFSVTNDGNVNLDPVNVTDPMPGLSALSCDATSLAPSASMTCTATYTVTQADVDAGSIHNMATATGTPPIGDDVTDTDDEDVPVPSPSKTIEKILLSNADEDGSGDVSAGDTLTYQITVNNTGTANLTNVVVTDNLTGNSTTCPLVIPGDDCVLTVTYVVQSTDLGTTIHNVGTGDSDQTDPVEDEEDVPVPSPSKTIEKILLSNADEDGSGDV